jgi:predicted nucleotidyltransferase
MKRTAQVELADRLQISEREWMLVVSILDRYLSTRKVWSFGSRATGKHLKRFSDLDLAVEGRLTWAERAALSEAFDEALINFKVDVLEKEMVEADFWERIEKDFVLVQGGD